MGINGKKEASGDHKQKSIKAPNSFLSRIDQFFHQGS